MACYYLVISSTHLSNGHYRSIKGVFRGPLRKSTGGESPDYAEKEKSIAKTLGDLKANFYCELCDKQYHKHQEFDNHINSYDHAHKQRLKELKQREFARNVSSKSWKDERKQKRALKRLHRLAQLKQQRESNDRGARKLESTTKHKDQVQIPSAGRKKIDTKPTASSIQEANTQVNTNVLLRELSSSSSSSMSKYQVPCQDIHNSTVKSTAGHRSPKAGVSFCFSRRAQLKLDSCASVFSDGLEEASEYKELQRHRQRLVLEDLWSYSNSHRTSNYNNHDQSSLGLMGVSTQTSEMDAQSEHVENLDNEARHGTNEQEKLGCPDTHSPGADWKPAGSKDRLVDEGQRPKAEEAYGGSNKRGCIKCSSPTVYTDGQGSVAQSQLQTHKFSPHYSQNTNEQVSMQSEKCCISEEKAEENSRHIICDDGTKEGRGKASDCFLNVITKDGNTMKWPSALVQYTSNKPGVSYSCNPFYICFKHRSEEKSTKAEGKDLGIIDRVAGQDYGARGKMEDVSDDILDISKPKRPKHKIKRKTCRRKLDAVKQQEESALKSCLHTEARGCFEFQNTKSSMSQNKQTVTKRRHKLGKRKRSVRNETLNESDTPEHSLKSIVVCSFSNPTRNRKKCQTVRGLVSALHLVNRRPLPNAVHGTTGKEERCRWYDGTCESKRDHASTPLSDKSTSWSGLSDLASDGEWPMYHLERYTMSPRLNCTYPLKKNYSQPRSYFRKSTCIVPHYSCRYTSVSPCRDFTYTGDCWDSSDEYSCHKRRHSAQEHCNSSEYIESQRHNKKNFVQKPHRGHKNQDKSRQIFCRVYDSPEPQNDVRTWWDNRLSPIRRRQNERDEMLWSSPERSEDRWFNKPIQSPSSSSSTSISDLSLDWMCNSVSPSSTKQTQKNCYSFEGSPEKLGKIKASCSHVNQKTQLPPLSSGHNSPQPNSSTNSTPKSDVKKQEVAQESISDSSNHCKLVEKGPKMKKTNATLLLPLIGKLPSIKKGAKKTGLHKEPSDNNNNPHQTSESLPPNLHVLLQEDKTTAHCHPTLKDQPNLSKTSNNLNIMPESCLPKLNLREHEDSFETSEIDSLRRTTPPLSEQPITFTDDEIEKYRLLQLQAQQHIQLQQQQEMHQSSVDTSPLPLTTPEQPDQAFSATLPYTMLPPSSSPSVLAPHLSTVTLIPPLHPSLSQTHFTPLSAAFFPAPSAALLASHSLPLIPATSLHPVHHRVHGLAFHPLAPASLLHTVLRPLPVAAAPTSVASAARTLHIHPLLHPLFHSQDLQTHPGSAS